MSGGRGCSRLTNVTQTKHDSVLKPGAGIPSLCFVSNIAALNSRKTVYQSGRGEFSYVHPVSQVGALFHVKEVYGTVGVIIGTRGLPKALTRFN